MDSVKKLSVFGVPVFCVITGASQGLGRALAINISSKLGAKSQMVITARNAVALAETKRLVECVALGVKVKVVVGDLGNPASLETLKHSVFSNVDPIEFQHAIIFHNAGSLGDVSKNIVELDNAEQLQQYNFMNITSAHLLTVAFLNVFKHSDILRRTVVQITSLAAIQPLPSWSMYCTAKAARDMLFGVLAKEEPKLRVLNYAPGPIGTDMFEKVLKDTKDDDLRKSFESVNEKGLVKINDTIAKLLNILETDEFDSGSHIDYFD